MKKTHLSWFIALIMMMLCAPFVQAQGPLIRLSADSLSFTAPRFTSGTELLTIYNDGGQPLDISVTDVLSTGVTQSSATLPSPARYSSARIRERLRLLSASQAENITLPDVRATSSPTAIQTTVITDSLNDTGNPGIDIVSAEISEDFFTYTFTLNFAGPPDSGAVAVMSLDVDQNFATGSFPAPLGVGPALFDIGSEYEIIFDIGGTISDTLGIPPSAIVIEGGDTTLTPVAVTLLTYGGNSVTATFIKLLSPALTLDGDINATVIALSLSSLTFPDFAPDYGHGLLGSELGVSWLAQARSDSSSMTPLVQTIAPGDSARVAVRLAAVHPEGLYAATLHISNNSSNAPQLDVPVAVHIGGLAQAIITVSPPEFADTLAVDGPAEIYPLAVSNTGSGNLTFFMSDSLIDGDGWLTIPALPLFQVDGGQTEIIELVVNPAGLSASQHYRAFVVILSSDFDHPRVEVPLDIYIQPTTGISGDPVSPFRFALHGNYPNPFNPATQIVFETGATETVRLAVFNVLGEQVRILVNHPIIPGRHQIEWDGRDDAGTPVASGVYLLRLVTQSRTLTRRMILNR